jgi:hypothetical protein
LSKVHRFSTAIRNRLQDVGSNAKFFSDKVISDAGVNSRNSGVSSGPLGWLGSSLFGILMAFQSFAIFLVKKTLPSRYQQQRSIGSRNSGMLLDWSNHNDVPSYQRFQKIIFFAVVIITLCSFYLYL